MKYKILIFTSLFFTNFYGSEVKPEEKTLNVWGTLKMSAINGVLDGFAFLIRHNKNFLNYQEPKNGMTLLMYACLNDRTAIVEKICEYTPDVNLNLENTKRENALIIATKRKCFQNVKILLENRASAVNSAGKFFYDFTQDEDFIKQIKEFRQSLNVSDEYWWCPIQ